MKNIKKFSLFFLFIGLIGASCSTDEENTVVPKTLEQYKQDFSQFVSAEKTKVQNCKMGYNKGDFKYSSDSTNFKTYCADYLNVLIAAEAVLAKSDLTIADIVKANGTLASPGKLFNSSLWISDRRPLNDAIIAAQELLAATPEGTDPGQAPAEARTAFTNAITAAKKVRDSSYTIERQVQEAVQKLEEAKNAFLAAIIH
ncbi:MAG: hypothetical protein KBG33_03530 [Paludibacteraceae bacterium]|jgi:hypothetical protein|nr:hypothetical protein [Paludibacteraceae bacterium]OPZ02604.1 MAG: hypothetical protein BWZ11_00771 [Bacteroidetes bacterium ADurb.BinA395]MBP8966453.1 hypothetical protein [Paludibacteraceae bacterium]HOF97877.1 hypothetical protein [Paludibacteraceae bacterium]HOR38452.1 hypothetical protein [Paludibacteraceae bacterium]